MKRLQPVIWSKGSFLTPQHIQSQDLFFEHSLQFQLNALNFKPWGFRKLQINREALATGNFTLLQASGIMPDGLLFDIPDSDHAPETKLLSPYFGSDRDGLDVYLAVPDYLERGANLSATPGAPARFISEIASIRDENSGLNEKPVPMARKNFRFMVEGDDLNGSTTIKIARIKRTTTGAYQFDARFVPPLLDLGVSDYLITIARRLVEILSALSTELAGLRRQKNEQRAEFTVADISNFWLLYTINTHFAELRHIWEIRKGHPERLFTSMLSLAGTLSAFSSTIQPHDLPLYEHDDLGRCFTELDNKLRLLLETRQRNFVSLPLKLTQPSVYVTAVDDEKYFADTKMYLAISAEMKKAELINKALKLLIVSSATTVEPLINHALPGVKLSHVAVPPSAIPIKTNFQYFSLNQSGSDWNSIRHARNLAAYVPADFPNPQLELIVVLPQSNK